MLISIKFRSQHGAAISLAAFETDGLRDKPSVQRFGNDPDAEDGPLRFIEQLHMPLGILLELAGNACRHVGTGAGQRLPGSIVVGAFGPEFGRAGVTTISDTEKIERHTFDSRLLAAPDRLALESQWIRKGG